eukprot:2752395-Pyramimonas_sp.AAC.1
MAPYGAPPRSPAAALAWHHRAHVGTSLTRFVAPWGAPPKTILTTELLTTAHGWVFRQADVL